MPSRLAEYASLLESARSMGYETHSVLSFWEMTRGGGVPAGSKHLILRHDVDTDVPTAREMFRVEREAGVRSTFYFRLCTVDVPLMQGIEAAGSEASYHYEELATVARRLGLRGEDLAKRLPEIRQEFRANLAALRQRTGLPIRTVASHGDFVNRKLGQTNCLILQDANLRRELGIEVETYDPEALAPVTLRCADNCGPPRYWLPCDPTEGMRRGEPVIYVLTHPRQWRVNLRANCRAIAERALHGLAYAFRTSSYGRTVCP